MPLWNLGLLDFGDSWGIVDPLGSFAIPLGYGEIHDIYAHIYALYVALGEGEIALMGERENGSAFCDKC